MFKVSNKDTRTTPSDSNRLMGTPKNANASSINIDDIDQSGLFTDRSKSSKN